MAEITASHIPVHANDKSRHVS
uniref:Uncharacterized protein n=1 Tax=Arundo donax TaxID=35708 RepID=A0A0A9GJK3_ARUDO